VHRLFAAGNRLGNRGSGYVGDAEVALLRRLRVPISVFADLDPDGIAIVADIAHRSQQPVTPLGMHPADLAAPQAVAANAAQLVMASRLSRERAAKDPPQLAEPARAILETGRVREQETLHDRLAALTASDPSGGPGRAA